MNGDVFRGLHNLKYVYLQLNQCIKQDFKTEAAIAKLPEVLSQNCGLCTFDDITILLVVALFDCLH
jgi:hypothetical protein